MSELDSRTKQARAFLGSSLIGLVSSLVAALGIETVRSKLTGNDWLSAVAGVRQVHWVVWVCVVAALYAIICYFVSRAQSSGHWWNNVFRVPLWTQLRSFGDQRVSRISYWVLAVIPAIAYLVSRNPARISVFEGVSLPLGVKLAFFASWFFSLALVLFTVGCPKEFRQQNSLAQARTINMILHEVSAPRILIEPETIPDDPELDSSALELRGMCFLFYIMGLALSGVILFRAGWLVVSS